MRCALLADIHANLAAFQAVLADIERRGGTEEIWYLGDIVGYGPDPRECLEIMRRNKHVCVAGNHDLAAIGRVDTADFNRAAAAAIDWTAGQLAPEDRDFLGKLSLFIEKDDFTLVHGSPREPVWEYILSLGSAKENFTYFNSSYCLIGHSHIPLFFRSEPDAEYVWGRFEEGMQLSLGESRLIINPGSVGQPRDRDPRASYAVYDSGAAAITLYRVAYDIRATQAKMVGCGLPGRLSARLSYGV